MWSTKLCEWIIFLHFHILHRFIYLLVLLQTFLIFHTFFEKLFERSKEIERVLLKLHAWQHLWLIYRSRLLRFLFATVLIVIICDSRVASTRRIDLHHLLLQLLKRGAIVCPWCCWLLLFCQISIRHLHLLLSIWLCFFSLINIIFVINKWTWVRLATLLLHFILEWLIHILFILICELGGTRCSLREPEVMLKSSGCCCVRIITTIISFHALFFYSIFSRWLLLMFTTRVLLLIVLLLELRLYCYNLTRLIEKVIVSHLGRRVDNFIISKVLPWHLD